MRSFKLVWQILLIFLLETIMQILLNAFVIKYFTESPGLDTLRSFILDNLKTIFPVKCMIYLPIYFLYTYYISNRKFSQTINIIIHCAVFLLVTIILSWALQINLLLSSFAFFISMFAPVIISPFIVYKSIRLE